VFLSSWVLLNANQPIAGGPQQAFVAGTRNITASMAEQEQPRAQKLSMARIK
jgi:hypothetical protein